MSLVKSILPQAITVTKYLDAPILSSEEIREYLFARYKIDVFSYLETAIQASETVITSAIDLRRWVVDGYPVVFLISYDRELCPEEAMKKQFYTYLMVNSHRRLDSVTYEELKGMVDNGNISLSRRAARSSSFSELQDLIVSEFGKQYDDGFSVLILCDKYKEPLVRYLLELCTRQTQS